ncbi:hypothetical protein [Bradyrhizobium sp. DASA03007]|uniref:hypothetical protein n=1 Tax=unclassified Bradyrhizobium TaxID=2631580 RepID=UPI003F6F49E2
MEEFYRDFAQRARDLAENAGPFTKRWLLDLASGTISRADQATDAPVPRATPPNLLFSGSGEVSKGGIAEIRCT